ncbi:hypothetical protein GC173_04330 [bacterium]|nr:hypothetical protein [bacterium]
MEQSVSEKLRRSRINSRRTLIEALIVLAIVTVLGVIFLSNFTGDRRSSWGIARSNQRSVRFALEHEFVEKGSTLATIGDAAGNVAPDQSTVLADWLRSRGLPERDARDPFDPNGNALRWFNRGSYGLLVSVGPDRVLSIRPQDLPDGDHKAVVASLVGPQCYDPTNGTISGGDLWMYVDFAPVPKGGDSE